MYDFLSDQYSSEMGVVLIAFALTGAYFIRRTFEGMQASFAELRDALKALTETLGDVRTEIEVNKAKDEALEKRIEKLETNHK